MTYTILTTHTLGGEIEIGFHRKADGTAYAFADVELVSATMHLARRDLSDAEVKEWRENYVEELGDVIIVTTQLRHLLSKEEKKALERSIKLKVVRQRQRIAAQLTQAAEIIEAQEKRRQAGLSFSPYEAHKEVLRAAADFDELRTIMEARS